MRTKINKERDNNYTSKNDRFADASDVLTLSSATIQWTTVTLEVHLGLEGNENCYVYFFRTRFWHEGLVFLKGIMSSKVF